MKKLIKITDEQLEIIKEIKEITGISSTKIISILIDIGLQKKELIASIITENIKKIPIKQKTIQEIINDNNINKKIEQHQQDQHQQQSPQQQEQEKEKYTTETRNINGVDYPYKKDISKIDYEKKHIYDVDRMRIKYEYLDLDEQSLTTNEDYWEKDKRHFINYVIFPLMKDMTKTEYEKSDKFWNSDGVRIKYEYLEHPIEFLKSHKEVWELNIEDYNEEEVE